LFSFKNQKAYSGISKLRISVAHLGGFQYEELIGCPVYFNISAVLTDLANRCGIKKTNEILRKFDTKRLILRLIILIIENLNQHKFMVNVLKY